jgi:hypothetical protein
MAQYLRDKHVSDVVIDEAALSDLVDTFVAQGLSMPEYVPQPQGANPTVHLSFTIRFDERGYRVFDKQQLLQHFNQATVVERIIFELISTDALQSNRLMGSLIDLRLDTNETVPCFLTVTSDDEAWMRSSFAAVEEVLRKHRRSASRWVRNPLVDLLIQLTGLLVGFVLSLWGATKIAPFLAIDNAFLISFLLVLLVFSNLWIPINQRVRQYLNSVFPRIRFDRPSKDRFAWLYRTVIGGLVVAAALYVLGLLFSYAGSVLGNFIAPGP